ESANIEETQEINFTSGLGKSTTEYVSNWNKLVSEISSNEETLLFFSIDPEKVRWETPEQKILVYRFAETENNTYTFTLNLGVEDDVVKDVQFFSPVQSDEVNSQQTKLFFLILIAIADDTLDIDGRENILTNLGLYDQVENPYQVGGTVTQNKIRYLIEPLVDNGLLIGLNFRTTQLEN
ncbi:MAG: hypothetical protein EBW04_08015, partial [Betaproteobacteria bacterium]|nr:hypothetical protein [Betaproteobacteria bacterium]